jgi:hypothetical protein
MVVLLRRIYLQIVDRRLTENFSPPDTNFVEAGKNLVPDRPRFNRVDPKNTLHFLLWIDLLRTLRTNTR